MAGQFGATFVPGGFDDYYMPEVVAPSPQRVTPQVPQNMQEDLQRMELEAREPDPRPADGSSSSAAAAASAVSREAPLSSSPNAYTSPRSGDPAYGETPASADISAYRSTESRAQRVDSMTRDAPSFSPFPKVKGDNVPPTDDDKEEILWNARAHVLHSQNVPMQITWARDVLNWAEIALDAAAREQRPRASTPRIEHEMRVDALSVISHLAEQDHPQALYIRSKWLEFGKFGNRVDKREAYSGYRRAAELGNPRAEYRMGMLFEQSNDMSKAKEHYYRGMSLKDSAALYRMGMMSLLGQHGEPKDYARGLERIQAAADSSDDDAPQGAYVYGMLVGRELPDIQIPEGLLPHNNQTARMYIEKSAYLGFAKAHLKMGQAFELCQFGCEFNPSLSLHYYGLAAKQGLPEAALGVSRWFLFGYEGVFKKNEELAYKYAEEAAAAKLATGEFALGYYNEIGIHVHKSVTEARKWYQLAAEHGNKDAVGRLESLDQDRTLSKTDHETTTLTRIKSQHMSMRGKRPERFKQAPQMPTLGEGDGSAPRPMLRTSPGPSPRVSPQPSPGLLPTVVHDGVNLAEPSRASWGGSERTPAYNMRVDSAGQRPRPVSAAPYPDDDRPAPLNVNRPRSTAPYPDDVVRPPRNFSPNARPASGPQADRPMSAFGIRGNEGQRPVPASQSMSNLHPDSRGRLPSAGRDPAGFRQPSPGPPGGRGGPYPGGDGRGRPGGDKPYPGNYPPGGPPPKQPQNHYPPGDYGAPPAGRLSQPPQGYDRRSQGPPSAARPERLSSLPQPDPRQSRVPSGGQGPPFNQPGPGYGGPKAGATPPGRPAHAATAPPQGGTGPATFEAMGIPQGKQDGDCVVM